MKKIELKESVSIGKIKAQISFFQNKMYCNINGLSFSIDEYSGVVKVKTDKFKYSEVSGLPVKGESMFIIEVYKYLNREYLEKRAMCRDKGLEALNMLLEVIENEDKGFSNLVVAEQARELLKGLI